MNNDTFVIEYGVYLKNGVYFSNKMKVKNCMSELHAKIKLEKYLQKKYDNFNNLVVYKCNNDKFNKLFNDILGFNFDKLY